MRTRYLTPTRSTHLRNDQKQAKRARTLVRRQRRETASGAKLGNSNTKDTRKFYPPKNAANIALELGKSRGEKCGAFSATRRSVQNAVPNASVKDTRTRRAVRFGHTGNS